jgi:hypothetical protein
VVGSVKAAALAKSGSYSRICQEGFRKTTAKNVETAEFLAEI